MAIAIGVGVAVKGDVDKFLKENLEEKVPLVLSYERPGFFSREQLLNIIYEIRDEIRGLMTVGGITEVHLFYGGPLMVAAALGAIADNWVPVKWYQRNPKTGQYEYAFTLDVETVKGI